MIYKKTQYVLAALAGFASICFAAEPQETQQFAQFVQWNKGSPYAGQCVVRVRTTSQAQLDQVLEIATDVWSERIGQGPLEIQLETARLGDLTAIGVPYDTMIEDLQTHSDAYAAELIRSRLELDATHPDGYQRGGMVHDDAWFVTYRTLAEITAYCENIETLRPDLATVDTIGLSLEGRDMFSIAISGPDSAANPLEERPAIFIFSTVHAREWIAPMTTCYIASKLVEQYDSDPNLQAQLDDVRIIIVPIGNPDGYLHSWSTYRFWRKNRRDHGNGAFGVDINRNWGFEWGGSGSSGSRSSNTYRGSEPFSEPETRVLRDVVLALDDKLLAHIDYHSYSQVVSWPFNYANGVDAPEPARSVFDALGHDLEEAIEHVHDADYRALSGDDFLGPAAGNSIDWFYGDQGVISYLVELRPRGSDFDPPPSTILPCAQENYAGFVRYIQRVLSPYNVWPGYYTTDTYIIDDVHQAQLRARVSSGLEFVHPENMYIRARKGSEGAFDFLPMERWFETDYYDGALPYSYCGSVVEYYYEAVDAQGVTGTRPFAGADAPLTTFVQQLLINLTDDMETDTGWIIGHPDDTATSGFWERVDPEPTEFQPGDDYTEDGTLCWVTDGRAGNSSGDFDVEVALHRSSRLGSRVRGLTGSLSSQAHISKGTGMMTISRCTSQMMTVLLGQIWASLPSPRTMWIQVNIGAI